jgi:hypothetical protein
MTSKMLKLKEKWTLKIFRSACEGKKGEKSRYISYMYFCTMFKVTVLLPLHFQFVNVISYKQDKTDNFKENTEI